MFSNEKHTNKVATTVCSSRICRDTFAWPKWMSVYIYIYIQIYVRSNCTDRMIPLLKRAFWIGFASWDPFGKCDFFFLSWRFFKAEDSCFDSYLFDWVAQPPTRWKIGEFWFSHVSGDFRSVRCLNSDIPHPLGRSSEARGWFRSWVNEMILAFVAK